MLVPLLNQLIRQIDLTEMQIDMAINHLLDPAVNVAQKSALLALLRAKGESVPEIVGFIHSFKRRMQRISLAMPVLDIVGTGGDGLRTINLSTGAALLAASCGIPVAKHGNRAVSSHCGSADVLAEMNISIDLPIAMLTQMIECYQFGFCFAPLFHPALKNLQMLRCALGIPTILNFLGPFLNPASAQHYVLGVHSTALLAKFAEILLQLNLGKSVVVHTPLQNSDQGMDEISTAGVAMIAEVDQKTIRYYTLDPQDFNLPLSTLEQLQGRSIAENVHGLMQAFEGIDGPVADSLALNAGMGLYVYGKCHSITEGLKLAQENLQNGSVLKLIETLQGEQHHA